MDLKSYLADFSSQLESYFSDFFTKKITESSKLDPKFVDIYSYLKEYILGGKKIRGALVKLGYEMYGGKNNSSIIPVCAAIELIHSGLLIQDDWIDGDKSRRGLVSAHIKFGAGEAIVIGDIAIFEAYNLIGESKIITPMSKYLVNTGYGEIMDIRRGPADIVHIYKTAHYSFVMPLSMGAILAGATATELKKLEDYGTNVGLAFQIRDDILNITGDPKVTGKSILSDITSKKQTHIWKFALDKNAFDPEHDTPEQIRDKFIACGAIDHAQKIANAYAKDAKNQTENNILRELADFVVLRDK